MNKKIFRSTFLTAIIVFAASLILLTALLFRFFENEQISELHRQTTLIAESYETQGVSYLKALSNFGNRITLIDPDGTVVYDNTTDASTMDNHADREEVRSALAYGSGQSIRFSNTRMVETVYYALRLDNGQVLRVSTTQSTIYAIMANMLNPIILVVAAAILLSLVISRRVARSISGPLNNLDLDHPELNDTYEELTPLLTRLAAQNQTIERQLKDARRKQDEFMLITENMEEGFLAIDRDTNVLTYNTSALRLLGIEGKPTGSVLQMNRTKDFRELLITVLTGRRVERDMEQDDRTYHLIASPVHSDHDAVIGAVIVIWDITESAKREVLRREFTANVSHELKTPLTSISGFAELMMQGGTPDETVVDFSHSIYQEASRLVQLVNDIIRLSSLDDGTISYEWENVDVFNLAREILYRLQPAADRKNVQLHLEGDHGEILAVESVLSEMISNVCDNAIKYNRDGGRVDVRIRAIDDFVVVMVEDTGIGIPQSDIGRIFERFYRVDKSRSKAVGGTGLGLSIVKHGASLHHASVRVKSKVGEGTQFIFRFRKNPGIAQGSEEESEEESAATEE